MIYIVPIS